MKNIITAIFVLLSTVAFAQSSRTGTMQAATAAGTIKARDTTTNTDTSYLWDARNDHNQWDVNFQFYNTNVSGTTTASIIVQGSNDATSVITGTWYTLINNASQNVSAVDTGTAVTTVYSFNIPQCQYRYLRVRAITGGTQTSYLRGTYYLASKFVGLLN